MATPNSFSCLNVFNVKMKVQERWREEVGMIKPKYVCETVRLPAARRLIKVMSLHKNGDLSPGPMEKSGTVVLPGKAGTGGPWRLLAS